MFKKFVIKDGDVYIMESGVARWLSPKETAKRLNDFDRLNDSDHQQIEIEKLRTSRDRMKQTLIKMENLIEYLTKGCEV